MGIWDNLKSRLHIGGSSEYDEYDDYEYDSYHDAYHDAYHDTINNVYPSDPSGGYHDDGTRAQDEYSPTHSPLVNMTDIRSQPVQLSRGAGSREDRIPMPTVRERRPSASVTGLAADDSEAFRDSLARSPQNSLPQLHTERIQLEANAVPEFEVPGSSSAHRATVASLSDTATSQPALLTQPPGAPRYNGGTTRSNAGAPIPRGPRTIEHLRPQSYSDAEEISICLRQGAAVVLDLTNVRPELAKRILDFSFGVTSAFEGQVDRYADRVYILTRNGALSDDERRQIRV
jgi:cell division inhibitor SepF